MAYQTYTTKAIVCGSRDRGASDKVYWLFTRDAGMVLARAKSVREMRSKLRFGLQDFSYTTVSLIRGKHDWRVVGTEPGRNFFFDAPSRDARGQVLRLVRFIRRLTPGEEAHPAFFRVVSDGLLLIATDAKADPDLEQLFMLRALYHLGYVAPPASLQGVVDAPTLAEAHRIAGSMDRAGIERLIGDAFSAAQL